LVRQNNLLYNQLEAANSQVAQMQEQFRTSLEVSANVVSVDSAADSGSSTTAHSGSATISSDEADEAMAAKMREQRNIDELRELVRIFRRDKEILATRNQIATQELSRYRQQLSQTVANLEQVQQQLREAQQRNQSLVQTESEHTALLRQVSKSCY
jgi:DNA repair exonuclease SbcCD ATPase subunit